jgi:hypothetical protein
LVGLAGWIQGPIQNVGVRLHHHTLSCILGDPRSGQHQRRKGWAPGLATSVCGRRGEMMEGLDPHRWKKTCPRSGSGSRCDLAVVGMMKRHRPTAGDDAGGGEGGCGTWQIEGRMLGVVSNDARIPAKLEKRCDKVGGSKENIAYAKYVADKVIATLGLTRLRPSGSPVGNKYHRDPSAGRSGSRTHRRRPTGRGASRGLVNC